MQKIIVSIVILLFVGMQASEKKVHIYQGVINHRNRSIDEFNELSRTCSFMAEFNEEQIEANPVVKSMVVGYAKHIQKMREDVRCINNPSLCVGNFSLSNYVRGISTHYEAMYKARLGMADIRISCVTIKEPYNSVVKEAYDWSKETRQQCLKFITILNKEKAVLDQINALYHRQEDFKSPEIQKTIESFQLTCLEEHGADCANIREFFGNESSWYQSVQRIADFHRNLEKKFTEKNKDSNQP